MDLSEWKNYVPKDIPRQGNSHDCGVFMCRFADCVAKNAPFEFGQEQVKQMQMKCVDICTDTLSEKENGIGHFTQNIFGISYS